jgi:aspartate beta-hydroxylase
MNDALQNKLRRNWSEIIGTLIDCGREPEAHRCAEQAVALGLWRNPVQRPTHYLPELAAKPVYDPKQFWFTGFLEKNFDSIKNEIMGRYREGGMGFRPYDARLIDMGKWEQLVLYEKGAIVERACEMLPVTSSLVSTISETSSLGMTCVSVVYPGTHIVPHCGPTNARLRVHLSISVPEGAYLEVGGERLNWKEGTCIVFDDSFEHQVWHRGDAARIVVIFDIWHPDLSPEDIQALSETMSVDDTIRSFMEERGLRRIESDQSGKIIRLYPDDQTNKAILRHMWEQGVCEVELRAGKLYYKKTNVRAHEVNA